MGLENPIDTLERGRRIGEILQPLFDELFKDTEYVATLSLSRRDGAYDYAADYLSKKEMWENWDPNKPQVYDHTSCFPEHLKLRE